MKPLAEKDRNAMGLPAKRLLDAGLGAVVGAMFGGFLSDLAIIPFAAVGAMAGFALRFFVMRGSERAEKPNGFRSVRARDED